MGRFELLTALMNFCQRGVQRPIQADAKQAVNNPRTSGALRSEKIPQSLRRILHVNRERAVIPAEMFSRGTDVIAVVAFASQKKDLSPGCANDSTRRAMAAAHPVNDLRRAWTGGPRCHLPLAHLGD